MKNKEKENLTNDTENNSADREEPLNEEFEEINENDKFSWKDLKSLNAGYWLLGFSFMLLYGMMVTVFALGTKQLVVRFGFD